MQLTNEDFKKILQVGLSLSTEKDRSCILAAIVNSGLEITNCDAATLYIYEENKLVFKIMKTISLGICKGEDGQRIEDIPPVPLREENVCAYTAIHGEIVNIGDVYHSDKFDFSGPKKYDALTGFRTQSMLVIPIADNEGRLMGVLQLMNAMDEKGVVIPFDPQYELIIRSLGSLAAVELANIQYMDEIKDQLHSFVEAMATAIDERTPYNGSHTRKVAEYSELLARYINRKYEAGESDIWFDDSRMEYLKLAALLHDIGKMIVPLNIMNRATRLDTDIRAVDDRIELLKSFYEIDGLRARISPEEAEIKAEELDEIRSFIHEIDGVSFLTDENYERVQKIRKMYYQRPDGTKVYYLTEGEAQCLSVRKGTLTEAARLQMENHVVMTGKILSKVHFSENYLQIPRWAASHHEFLDGSGYPDHKKAGELDLETRILTVTDIYDALTATDRPYKKPMTRTQAITILKDMARKGKVELRLVEWLDEALEEGGAI